MTPISLKPENNIEKEQDMPLSLQSVCVYCGSSNHVDDSYKHAATAVGTALAEHKLRVIYGGGHVGLMGKLADAVLAAQGEVVGIIPDHICAHEVQHPGLTELIVVDSMHTRKKMMADKSDAFVVLPGGFGTLDEAFEILTWKQLGLHSKPVVLYNVGGYWDPLIALIDSMVKEHFAPSEDNTMFTNVDTPEAMIAALEAPHNITFDPERKWA